MKDNKPSEGGEPTSAAQCQASLRHRILVVEDDEDMRRLNTEVLKQFGYQVDAVEDGAIAWDTLQRNKYDLVVTDNAMPNLSGVELLRKLHAARMALPVIMATGALPKESMQDPWPQPIAMLLKPYTLVALVAAVQEVLPTTSGAREQNAPPPNEQSQPPKAGWLL